MYIHTKHFAIISLYIKRNEYVQYNSYSEDHKCTCELHDIYYILKNTLQTPSQLCNPILLPVSLPCKISFSFF